MEDVLNHPSVLRVKAVLQEKGFATKVVILQESARSAAEAAAALDIEVGQVASSIVFKLPSGLPLLVITSGQHRVDTELVARTLGVSKLHRADADYVKAVSGFAIGGVSPIGWLVTETNGGVSPIGWKSDGTLENAQPLILIDLALAEFAIIWAAAGHPHAVFPTSYDELLRCTGARPMKVGE
jgi:prolyl-tRNA editing enzyme YbaK/EbsC (Cys-tRNA(Pro) deacylase)